MKDISDMRQSYELNEALQDNHLGNNPFENFSQWFEQAKTTDGILEANAFVLSTANSDGRVRSRTVLLKYFNDKGFVFFTNYGSQKAQDIKENAHVSMVFPWYALERQMLIEGTVEKVSHAESLKYFLTRPRGSQIGAWVSEQSKIVSSRALLQDKVKQLGDKFKGKDVPLPSFWGGFIIKPQRFEFWQGQPSRLHDRMQFLLDEDKQWNMSRLSP